MIVIVAGFAIQLPIHAQEPTRKADTLFRRGNFEAAAEAYQSILSTDKSDSAAYLRLAEIALLKNDLAVVEGFLKSASLHGGDKKKLDTLFAELYFRKNEFKKAAPYFRELGKIAKADKLSSFGEERPYQIDSDQPNETRIQFVRTDPLPVISIKVNGADIFAIIDTGGSELILDPKFASEIEAERFGKDEGMFAGGKRASLEHARIDSLGLGELTVKNVPVELLPTRRFSAVAGGKKIDAVVGTVLLKQFFFSLDYSKQALVLSTKPLGEAASDSHSFQIPFYLAGDHFVVAEGSVNGSDPAMFFVDTGLAGQAFTCPKSTLDSAGIEPKGPVFQGMGGGGEIDIQMFSAKTLSLGNAEKKNVTGLYGPFPESLETSMGFRIGGLISHSFFRDFAVDFDFEKMKITLRK